MTKWISGVVLALGGALAHAQCGPEFTPGTSFDTHGGYPYYLAVADLNADGVPDFVTANYFGSYLSVNLRNADGSFRPYANYTLVGRPQSVVVADFDLDGVPDVAAPSETGSVSVLRGQGNGVLSAPQVYPVGGGATGLAVGDFNHDGRPDLAVAATPGIVIMLADVDGVMHAQPPLVAHIGGRIVSADFNTDGNPDLVGPWAGEITVLLGRSDGTFAEPVSYATGGEAKCIAVADLDGDGISDVAVANRTTSDISILRGRGDGSFAQATNYGSGGFSPWSVAVGDLNGDGRSDLAVTNQATASIAIFEGSANGSFRSPFTFPTANGHLYLVLADLDRDGRLDIAAVGGPSGGQTWLNSTVYPPEITQQPSAQAVRVGETVVLDTQAVRQNGGNGASLTYQWRTNGRDARDGALASGASVSGARTPRLTIVGATPSEHLASVECLVADGCAAARTAPAVIEVLDECHVDFNGDGFVDFFDYDDFVRAFEEGC